MNTIDPASVPSRILSDEGASATTAMKSKKVTSAGGDNGSFFDESMIKSQVDNSVYNNTKSHQRTKFRERNA